MKRMLWTITAIGALAIPAGWAVAQTDDDTTVDTETPTTVVCDHEQVRDQLRLHDGTGDRERAQERQQAHECDGCDHLQLREHVGYDQGQGAMTRNQFRVEDGTGDQVRTQDRVEDGTGDRDRVGRQDRDRVQDATGSGAEAG